MPSYKSHAIHGELILPQIDRKIDIDKEDLKSFCMGPDALVLTDYKTFDYQHSNKTKEFFITMLKIIKENKLQDNKETMAYLYGQIDHFVLDSVIHPLIYYMTEDIKTNTKIKAHGLVENWIDDYIIKKYNKKELLYYRKWFIKDAKLMKVINELYSKVYHVKNEGLKYSYGMLATVMYDTLIRRNVIGIVPLVIKLINIGDFIYQNKLDRVLPYLNLDNDVWYNPETGEKYNYSFDDLWKKSLEVALETIKDINNYLYQDKSLNNSFIMNNISFNTGLPCKNKQKLKYIKNYK